MFKIVYFNYLLCVASECLNKLKTSYFVFVIIEKKYVNKCFLALNDFFHVWNGIHMLLSW